jgi:1-deoxy-D-xylulose-5-phosphate reductoisomerase
MPWKQLNLADIGTLTFKAPDQDKYPCIALAYEAGRTGGTMTAALNAANERANELFRAEKLGYLGIPKSIEMVMEMHKKDLNMNPSLEDIVNVDIWARKAIDSVLPKVNAQFTINV